jgi:peptidoglycan/xylan/chitin deacetylase (PgdA/CDA1 family)
MSTISIFMYHDIRDAKPSEPFYGRYKNKSFVNLLQFKNQLAYLTRRFTVISPFQIQWALQDRSSCNYAVLTFDDGLVDHYRILPLLEHFGVTATFFIPGNVLDPKFIIDSNQVQMLESEVDWSLLVQEIMTLIGDGGQEAWHKYSKSKFKVNTWPKEKTFITNCLRDYPKDLINPLFRKYITDDYESISNMLYLNDSQILDIVDAGHIIGGHGFTSRNLLLLNSEDMREDIKLTTEFITKYQDKLVFSYPNGGFDASIVSTLAEFGFEYSFTTEDKSLTQFDVYENLEIPRYCGAQRIPYD